MNKPDESFNSAVQWFAGQNWTVFDFQRNAWEHFASGKHGLVNAPTGSGKTFSLMIPILLKIRENKALPGLKAIWISPIRSLTKEIESAANEASKGLGIECKVLVRTGDSTQSSKRTLFSKPPDILITTPESLHIILSNRLYPGLFENLIAFVADEWHEVAGSKRGVLIELALSRLKSVSPALRIWGISATIGNLPLAMEVLLGNNKGHLVKSTLRKEIEIKTLMPGNLNSIPWAGHLGIHMIAQVLEIIEKSKTTLIFTNTRSQCEIWYQRLLEANESLSGDIAMHHGSLDQTLRHWVEDALETGNIKAVVCTSSLDLGVDFRPVDSVIQIGSPKGVARFMQRAGRAGHQPGAISHIYFVPTHALEIAEGAALRSAIQAGKMEQRLPYIRSFDVLIQYLITLAVGGGFIPAEIFPEVKKTHCFKEIDQREWEAILNFIVHGGSSLDAYPDFYKVVEHKGRYRVLDRQIALRHRMSIGTIVSDAMMQVKFKRGSKIGVVEEWFIAQLNPGDSFWFGGRHLELDYIKEMTAYVRKASGKKGKVPSWQGGRMPFSSQLSETLKSQLDEYGEDSMPELRRLAPLFEMQQQYSKLPGSKRLLVEYFNSRDGYHIMMYPFEGWLVHEVMAALIAYRISKIQPISFSIAINDYGFELLSDQKIAINKLTEEIITPLLFSTDNLADDLRQCINSTALARRRFRDIAGIAGLIFKGYPGRPKRNSHLQSTSGLFFDVFMEYEPDHLLLQQAFEEVTFYQMEADRLKQAMDSISKNGLVITTPEKITPFAFPIIADRLRETISSEKLSDRIARMQVAFNKS